MHTWQSRAEGTQAGAKMRKKILLIAMGNSIHTIRWVSLFAEMDCDIYLFNSFTIPTVSYEKQYPSNVVLYNFEPTMKKRIRLCFKHPRKSIKLLKNFSMDNFICAFAEDLHKAEVEKLAELIDNNDFSLIHTLHTQNSGMLLMEAIPKLHKKMPVWVNTVWGSDLYLHQWIPESKSNLLNILPMIDYYWGEGIRDYSLARSLGFKGEFLPPIPAFGGFDMEELEKLEYIVPSKRKRILIKGYMNVVGRAEIAFHALERCVDLLEGYEIVIFSYENIIITTIGSIFSNKYNIPVTAISGVSYTEILKLHLSSRMCIALSTSDGLPASFIESMACGEFPIQSKTSMCDEWAVDGDTALFVDAGDVNEVSDSIRRVLQDDEFVDSAAEKNRKAVREKLDNAEIKKQVISIYEKLMGIDN